jgi:hypothetical protein
MAALYSRSVSAAEPATPGAYKRVLVCPDGQSAGKQEAKDDSDSAESGTDDEDSSLESANDEHPAQPQYGYSRCIPTRAPDVEFWTSEGGSSDLYNSIRASDAGSVISKRSSTSNGDKRPAKTG